MTSLLALPDLHRGTARLLLAFAAVAIVAFASALPVTAADDARVRVLHAAPDGPAVDFCASSTGAHGGPE